MKVAKAIVCVAKGYKEVYVREDCAAEGCVDPDCDVCHLHDMPCDDLGLCEDCNGNEEPDTGR